MAACIRTRLLACRSAGGRFLLIPTRPTLSSPSSTSGGIPGLDGIVDITHPKPRSRQRAVQSTSFSDFDADNSTPKSQSEPSASININVRPAERKTSAEGDFPSDSPSVTSYFQDPYSPSVPDATVESDRMHSVETPKEAPSAPIFTSSVHSSVGGYEGAYGSSNGVDHGADFFGGYNNAASVEKPPPESGAEVSQTSSRRGKSRLSPVFPTLAALKEHLVARGWPASAVRCGGTTMGYGGAVGGPSSGSEPQWLSLQYCRFCRPHKGRRDNMFKLSLSVSFAHCFRCGTRAPLSDVLPHLDHSLSRASDRIDAPGSRVSSAGDNKNTPFPQGHTSPPS
eukprot:TRINITY_DN47107_c0_g1_i1.p1 TRINITY_DN47107_c0_g1~~TRINITY_DN47107_c0_g1_i1.p1  ORF type:complete len:339 (+),score=8.14 TRINITY_DN47107_c0_g1_i1:66-1082(+)